MAPAVQRRNAKKQGPGGEGEKKKKKQLTAEELKAEEEREERELEEWCEAKCGLVIRIVMVGSTLWGLLGSAVDFWTRPPILLERSNLRELTYVVTGATSGGVGFAAAEFTAKIII